MVPSTRVPCRSMSVATPTSGVVPVTDTVPCPAPATDGPVTVTVAPSTSMVPRARVAAWALRAMVPGWPGPGGGLTAPEKANEVPSTGAWPVTVRAVESAVRGDPDGAVGQGEAGDGGAHVGDRVVDGQRRRIDGEHGGGGSSGVGDAEVGAVDQHGDAGRSGDRARGAALGGQHQVGVACDDQPGAADVDAGRTARGELDRRTGIGGPMTAVIVGVAAAGTPSGPLSSAGSEVNPVSVADPGSRPRSSPTPRRPRHRCRRPRARRSTCRRR